KVADEVKEGIKDKARKLEADAVICYRQNLTGVRTNGDYIFAYGTAVRFI
ncbi:MAG: heavy metal-binding domain-containing protein, partial [Thermoguttaceae bacterium]|nr:heavy metal-binding domain-containing protein [Thermoguttaceae bacterium]